MAGWLRVFNTIGKQPLDSRLRGNDGERVGMTVKGKREGW